VLLDDKVDLEVPIEELAVHEPDARKLIAFLKADGISASPAALLNIRKSIRRTWKPMAG